MNSMTSTRLIAIACEGPEGLAGNVSGHFGHTPVFVVAALDGATVVSTTAVASPGHGVGCSMPQFVGELGVGAVVVGGLGAGAANRLHSLGIDVIGGVSGNAGEALRALASGTLEQGDATCSGHGTAGHVCGHHHHHD